MTQLHFLMDWATWASGVAFWVCLTWPLVIATFWKWWQSEWGWNMVSKTELIALALLPTTCVLEFGLREGWALQWLLVISISLIPVVVCWRTWIIFRGQFEGSTQERKDRGTNHDDSHG
jgi:hypothetical protein